MVCKWFHLCPLRSFEEKKQIDFSFRDTFCSTELNWKKCARYQAEENGEYHPDELLPDGSFLQTSSES